MGEKNRKGNTFSNKKHEISIDFDNSYTQTISYRSPPYNWFFVHGI